MIGSLKISPQSEHINVFLEPRFGCGLSMFCSDFDALILMTAQSYKPRSLKPSYHNGAWRLKSRIHI